MWTVYKHTNKVNGKVYIGITGEKVDTRWGKYGKGYSKQPFGNAILKYGWINFNHEVLFTGLTKDEAEQKEIELIEEYDSTNETKGYNVLTGSPKIKGRKRQNFNPIWLHTKEVRDKIGIKIICNGEIFNSMLELCEKYGLRSSQLRNWLNGTAPVPKKYRHLDIREYDNDGINLIARNYKKNLKRKFLEKRCRMFNNT